MNIEVELKVWDGLDYYLIAVHFFKGGKYVAKLLSPYMLIVLTIL